MFTNPHVMMTRMYTIPRMTFKKRQFKLLGSIHIVGIKKNKARYTATPVACRWAGAIFEVT